MALPATMDWEVRRGASGSGGYKRSGSGTDYSQQDSPQIANPGDWSVKNSVYTKLYSVTQNLNLVAALVDNTIKITAGTNFTVGTYHISGVGTDGDGNYLTLDRDCATGNSTNGAGVVGGAADIEDIDSKLIAGNRVYIKYNASSYNPAADIYFSVNGSSANRITIEGYYAIRGDEPIGDNRPFIDDLNNAYQFRVADNYDVNNIKLESADSYAFYMNSYCRFRNCYCKDDKGSTCRAFGTSGSNNVMIDCEATAPNGYGGLIGYNSITSYCHFHDCSYGVSLGSESIIDHCIINGCTITGITTSSGLLISHCTIDDNAEGIDSFNDPMLRVLNNQITNNDEGMAGTGTYPLVDYNNFYGNGVDIEVGSTVTKGSYNTANDPSYAGVGNYSDVDSADAFTIRLGVG